MSWRLLGTLGLALCTIGAAGRGPVPERLLYHVETLDGKVLASHSADLAFNPASVIKVATTLWAVELLGPEHRYATRIGYRGTWDPVRGRIDGQLVVVGGWDPDFQAENAILVARKLNELGVREVSDGLVVSGPFSMGWERGVEGRLADPQQRAVQMARRLRDAFDPARWNRFTRGSWYEMSKRRGWDPAHPPAVKIANGASVVDATASSPLVQHLSGPLTSLLKRFNVYSNNDIVRVADGLGGAAELQRWLAQRVGAGEVELETASGEGHNSMTARMVVSLMRELHRSVGRLGLSPQDLLPLPGCDPGPAARNFPLLSAGEHARTVAAKTGTLRITDNGVAVLAGTFTNHDNGEVLFCVAAQQAGNRLHYWRRVEQSWLLDVMQSIGGAVPRGCGQELPLPDTWAVVEDVRPPDAEAVLTARREPRREGVCQTLAQ